MFFRHLCLRLTGFLKQKRTNKENMRLDVNQEIITPRVPQFSADLNVENLCGKQTTQLELLIVNPNGHIDPHCSFDDETHFHSRLLLLLMTTCFLLSAEEKVDITLQQYYLGSRYFVISKAKCPLGNIRGIT